MSEKSNVFIDFLKCLSIRYTKSFSYKYFNEHPHKYNLFGLSKMLSEYGVESAAVKIKNKDKDLSILETPFIAHVGTEFVVVKKISTDKIDYIWNGKNINISVDEFNRIWTGIILLAEPDEKIKRTGI